MKLTNNFYGRGVLQVAPDLLGKVLVRRIDEKADLRGIITEVEAYGGEEDLASHVRVGKTSRNAVMYKSGGLVYMYLIYGMYWMVNVVTGKKEEPEAVLIRGVWVPKEQGLLRGRVSKWSFGVGRNLNGPGKVGKYFGLNKKHYGLSLVESDELWIEDVGLKGFEVATGKRIGVDYADDWAEKPWRFWIVEE